MKIIFIIIIIGSLVFFNYGWHCAIKDGFLSIDKSKGNYKGVIWKRDLPSWNPTTSSMGITKLEVPFTIIEYFISGKKALQADREFKDKYVYGKTIDEANKVYGL